MSAPAERLGGRVAIVTGAAHGIGRAICVQLAQTGALVAACDIESADLEQTRQAVAGSAGRECRTGVVDVTQPRQVEAFVQALARDAGGVDILVNNAGGVGGQTMRPVEEVSDEDWRRIFAINLDGAFHFTRAVAPLMKARRRGSIVNISSGAGRAWSLTGIQAYASAKAGLIGFTRQTAQELGPWGVRVNCVAPGFVRSNPASERAPSSSSPPTRPPTSPARPSAWTGEGGCWGERLAHSLSRSRICCDRPCHTPALASSRRGSSHAKQRPEGGSDGAPRISLQWRPTRPGQPAELPLPLRPRRGRRLGGPPHARHRARRLGPVPCLQRHRPPRGEAGLAVAG
jgi:3-oxoacyl-[acyl-carrier protein] reductase